MIDRFEQLHVVRLKGLESANATSLPHGGAAEVSDTIQISSISSRALLASNPVERREGLRIPRELAPLSAKPNSLCSQNAPLLLGPILHCQSPAKPNPLLSSPWVAGEARAGFHPWPLLSSRLASGLTRHSLTPILDIGRIHSLPPLTPETLKTEN